MRKYSSEKAFTLIELLVVVAIISILASIAIPIYREQKIAAFNALARGDLNSIVIAQEAGFLDSSSYVACADNTCNNTILPGFNFSEGVTGTCTLVSGGESYECGLNHQLGDRIYYYSHTGSYFWDTPR
jgi:prepilin-type N-terminal cleavage/methylation domain-containing protein